MQLFCRLMTSSSRGADSGYTQRQPPPPRAACAGTAGGEEEDGEALRELLAVPCWQMLALPLFRAVQTVVGGWLACWLAWLFVCPSGCAVGWPRERRLV